MINDLIKEYISAINNHNVQDIINLMSADHRFIDSTGMELTGVEELKKAWTEYFKMFPDYKIISKEIFSGKNTSAIIGFASGTYTKDGILKKENKWKIPVAWYAEFENEKIKTWQIFADVFPIIQIMDKYS